MLQVLLLQAFPPLPASPPQQLQAWIPPPLPTLIPLASILPQLVRHLLLVSILPPLQVFTLQ